MAERTKPKKDKYELIKKFEGPLQTTAFEDPPGQQDVYSIGHGTRSHKGETITPAEGERRFDEHMKQTETLIDRVVKVPLNPAQREAVVDYQYNTGALPGSKVLDRLNRGDYVGAAKEMDIVTAAGKPIAGLKDRRRAERERMVPAEQGPEPRTLADLTKDLEAKYAAKAKNTKVKP